MKIEIIQMVPELLNKNEDMMGSHYRENIQKDLGTEFEQIMMPN